MDSKPTLPATTELEGGSLPVAEPQPPHVPAPDATLGGRFRAFRERNHLAFEVAFFFAGFLFDVVLLHRIDSVPLLIHQGSYLVLTALLVFWDHRIHVDGREPGGIPGRIASYRLWVMHFFLGTLLNAFVVFYFRSASGFFGILFVVALAAVILVNELPRFRGRGPVVRVALLAFCTTSYFAYLIPVLWGELRSWQYVLATALGAGATVGLWRVFQRFTHDPTWTARRAVFPGVAVQGLLLALYFAEVIPPVPLSVKHLGIYNSVTVEKREQRRAYRMTYEPSPWWRPWDTAAAPLRLEKGERAWAFVRIFAPARFRDTVTFAWDFDDPARGWTALGTGFVTGLSGGNEQGYRLFAYTTPARSGAYRVRVLTADGREIARERFEVLVSSAPVSRILVETVDE